MKGCIPSRKMILEKDRHAPVGPPENSPKNANGRPSLHGQGAFKRGPGTEEKQTKITEDGEKRPKPIAFRYHRCAQDSGRNRMNLTG